jgi:hypothetical protein
MKKRILIIVTVLAITLLIGSISMAEPKDPAPGVTLPTREMNVDADGNIMVHEQGVVDVNMTNSSTEVTGSVEINNFPATQDVEVISGIDVNNLPTTTQDAMEGDIPTTSLATRVTPVTRSISDRINLVPGETKIVDWEEILATAIHWSCDDEKFVAWDARGTGGLYFQSYAIWDKFSAIKHWSMNFTHPEPIKGISVECRNSDKNCSLWFTISGFPTVDPDGL